MIRKKVCLQCMKEKAIRWFKNGVCSRCNSINLEHYQNQKDMFRVRKFKGKITLKQLKKLTSKCALCKWKENIMIHHIIHKKLGGTDDIDNLVGLCPNHHAKIHFNFKYFHIGIKRICKFKKIPIPQIFAKIPTYNKIKKKLDNKKHYKKNKRVYQ